MMTRFAHHQLLALSAQHLAFYSKLPADGYQLMATTTEGVV